jgi:hypothetical protein
MLITVLLLAVLACSLGLGLFLARIVLESLLVALGGGQRPVIRWHLITFTTMLFWIWYFAPRLLALN